ncbi:hypothetical protein ENUP19_0287G0029 [Entamoeba nuttalli]|uniref:TLDc domain-containing protein n=2 Tax=Entamoeba nuttalli TaxID=412467 RepID=K2HTE2_ENTNP|nr:hypothetical protein ENU1_129140 [Entamoeba nuttalli P19]EKE39415.1 hypothetical protein ENU1_129140 [Entamoeba nuttalli P19]|eukprot:XP_008858249.1 hypothetical protein ENU1_129140 [Entamoeba nuttalli P19]
MNPTSYSPNINDHNIVFGGITPKVYTQQKSYEGQQQSYEGQQFRINPIPMNGCLYNMCQSQNLENNVFKQCNSETKQMSFVNQENSSKEEITLETINNDVFNILQLLNYFQNQYVTRSDCVSFHLLNLTLQSLLHITSYMKKLESEKLINSKLSTNETKGSESSKTDSTKPRKGQKDHTKEDKEKLHSSDSESSDSESSDSESDNKSDSESDSQGIDTEKYDDEESSTESGSPSDMEVLRPIKTLKNSFREYAPAYLQKKNEKFQKKVPKELFYYNRNSTKDGAKDVRNEIIEAMNNTNISLFILTEDCCIATYSKQKSEADKGWNEDDSFKIYQLMKDKSECYIELRCNENKSFELTTDPLFEILTAFCAFSITRRLEICYKPDGDIFGTLPYTVVPSGGAIKTLGSSPGYFKEKIDRILIVKWN